MLNEGLAAYWITITSAWQSKHINLTSKLFIRFFVIHLSRLFVIFLLIVFLGLFSENISRVCVQISIVRSCLQKVIVFIVTKSQIMGNNIGVIVQARFDSNRFSGKAISSLSNGEASLRFLLRRLSKLNQHKDISVVLATSESLDCDVLEHIAIDLNVAHGNKSNVYARFLSCSKFPESILS